MSAFTSKSIDFICMKDSVTASTMTAMGIKDKHESDPNGYTAYTIYPNSKVEGDPWYKTEVRQAVLLYGIDWDAVAMMAGGKTATKSLQFDIKGALSYVDGLDAKAAYDINKAKSMLSTAGYPNGFSTKIYSPATTTAAATAVQDQLKKLNITAEIVKVTPQDKSRSDGVTPGLSMVMFTSAYDVVYKVMSSFINPKAVLYGPNIQFSDAFNDAYTKALSAKTLDERAQYGKTAAQLLNFDECKIRTMYMVSDPYFIQDYLKDSNYNVGFELYNITPEKAWLDK
jgi:peptide/nickel transport system substrate-binding protein